MQNRILYILEQFKLSPSQFADLVDIPRSNLSHVINGRNKASLDLIQKILSHFDSINPEWLLTGKEPFLKKKTLWENLNFKETEKQINQETKSENPNRKDSFRQIEKVLILYTDGKFEEFNK